MFGTIFMFITAVAIVVGMGVDMSNKSSSLEIKKYEKIAEIKRKQIDKIVEKKKEEIKQKQKEYKKKIEERIEDIIGRR